jgi:hypothetical protein
MRCWACSLPTCFTPKSSTTRQKEKGTCLMGEKSGSVGRLDVAMLAEVDDKVVIGENACLRESVHAFGDLEVDKSIDDE